jgi:KDO2-lipid IV(A) lauroyltransferase
MDVWLFLCPRDRIIVRNNLRKIGAPSNQDKETFYRFSRYWIDFFSNVQLTKGQIDQIFRFEGLSYLDEALDKGEGVILLTGHLGNWELGGLALGLKGYAVSAVAMDHKNSRINQFFITLRESKGVKVIPLGKAGRECIRVLRSNRVLALLGDRIFDPSEKKVRVSFFEGAMDVPRGPAYLAYKTGAVVVPTFIIMEEPGRYVFRCFPGIDPRGFEGQEEAVCFKIMQEYVKVFESCVEENPTQWFAFQDIWKAKF